MIAFYMDHHVHRAITEELRRRGIDVLTAFEDGNARLDDALLLDRATELDRVLVTQDKGFLRIGARCQRTNHVFSGIVFAIQEQPDRGRTIEHLELIARVMLPEEMRNQVEYLPAR